MTTVSLDLCPAEFQEITRLAEAPTASAVVLDLGLLLGRGLVEVRDDRVFVDAGMQTVIDCLTRPVAVINVRTRGKASQVSSVISIVAERPALAVTETADGARLALVDRSRVVRQLLREALPIAIAPSTRPLAELELALVTELHVLLRPGVDQFAVGLQVLLMSDGSAALLEPLDAPEPRPLADQQALDSLVQELTSPLIELLG